MGYYTKFIRKQEHKQDRQEAKDIIRGALQGIAMEGTTILTWMDTFEEIEETPDPWELDCDCWICDWPDSHPKGDGWELIKTKQHDTRSGLLSGRRNSWNIRCNFITPNFRRNPQGASPGGDG